MVKFRHGLVIGLAVGYYLGAKAGRERYVELERWLDKLRSTPQYADARGQLRDLYAQGKVKTKGLLDEATGGAVDMILDARPGGGDDTDLAGDPTFN